MKKRVFLYSAIVAAFMLSLNIYDTGMIAYAADGSEKTGVSKGIIIAVMIAVFIVTAVGSGFVTYKLKKGKNNSSDEKMSSDKKK